MEFLQQAILFLAKGCKQALHSQCHPNGGLGDASGGKHCFPVTLMVNHVSLTLLQSGGRGVKTTQGKLG
uniref:Uncharacterized protein n=1 Tax=Romanomermis culicivorax TaxID=13658 RepID=A0A915IYV8_ROMCU